MVISTKCECGVERQFEILHPDVNVREVPVGVKVFNGKVDEEHLKTFPKKEGPRRVLLSTFGGGK